MSAKACAYTRDHGGYTMVYTPLPPSEMALFLCLSKFLMGKTSTRNVLSVPLGPFQGVADDDEGDRWLEYIPFPISDSLASSPSPSSVDST